MSVINQMLRDLDRREANVQPRALADRLRLQPSTTVPKWRTAAAGCVIAGGVLYVGYALSEMWERQEVREAAQPSPAPVAVQAAPATPDAGASLQAGPHPVNTANPEPSRPVDSVPPSDVGPPLKASAPETMPVAFRTVTPAAAHPDAQPAGKAISSPATAVVHTAPAPLATAVRPQAPADPSGDPDRREPVRDAAPAAPRVDAPRHTAPAQPGAPKIEKKFSSEMAPRTADGEFRQAAQLIGQGRIGEAQSTLRGALELDAGHEAARQTLAALLIEERAYDAAQTVLAEGLRRNPAQINFALAIARMKFESGDVSEALAVLRDHARHAAGHAEYRAFHAALLARTSAHADAAAEYEAALRIAPGAGAWWLGLALAREALGESEASIDALRRARMTRTLSANLEDLVERKLRGAQ